jgi:prepilin-type N-terminal cleavage/methylation domain-containing protein
MKNKAFTLLELLVVITIIGILSSIVIVSMSGSTDSATIAKGKAYAQQVHALLGANAVGVWNFDEGTGTTVSDISGYGNNGTLSGDTHFVNSDIEGYALSFDGNGDYVSIPSISKETVKTIEIWANLRQLATVKGYHNYLLYCLVQHSANNFFYVFGTVDYFNWVPSIDIWYHLVFTFPNTMADTTGATLIINGNILKNISYQGEDRIGVDITKISNSGTNYAWDGLIDNIRIYSETISAAEIQKHYVQGLNKLLANQAITQAEYDQRMKEFNQSLVSNP